jgi:acrylyl-CoA reductase (NADPH)
MPFILRGVNLVGVNSGATARAPRLALWQRIAGDLKPRHFDTLVSREIAFDELPGAFAGFIDGRVHGRTLVRVGA